jgi:hypothetical protein
MRSIRNGAVLAVAAATALTLAACGGEGLLVRQELKSFSK